MPKLQTNLLCAHAWSQLETTSQSELFEDVWLPELTFTNKNVTVSQFHWMMQMILVLEFLKGLQLKMKEALP